MAHSHEHHHEHVHELTSLNKSFIIGITLNICLSSLSSASVSIMILWGCFPMPGTTWGDGGKPCLAMLAFRLAKVHPNSRYIIRL